jgi:hypothetical protein
VQHFNELRRLTAYNAAIPNLLHGLPWVEDRRVKEAIAGALSVRWAKLFLARRAPAGRRLIMAAAAGFYLEMALGLADYERSVLAAAIFAVCVPAEA